MADAFLRPALYLLLGTLLPTLGWYHRARFRHGWATLGLYFVVPALAGWAGLGHAPGDYGLRLGDAGLGLLGVAVGVVLMTGVLAVLARRPGFALYYGAANRPLPAVIVDCGLHLFGWEFLFRGFLLFGLAPDFGPAAIAVQAVPFALAHLGKPEPETLSTFFGGLAFGYLAWRTGSFLYPFLIHWYQLVLMIVLAQHAHAQTQTRPL